MSFIITGLPRSQTYWAARLFRSNGFSCVHDDLSMGLAKGCCPEILLDKVLNNEFGISDAGIPLVLNYYKDLLKLPMVVIRRSVEDVYNSFLKINIDANLKFLKDLEKEVNALACLPNVLCKRFPLNQEDSDEILDFCTGSKNNKFKSKNLTFSPKKEEKIRRLMWVQQ